MPPQAIPRPVGPVAFVGDSHLVAGDETTRALARFIEGAPGRIARLVLVGDIFDLWLARPHLHEDQHRRILASIREASARGLHVDYVVGNRDFGVESLHESPFSRIASEILTDPAPTPAWVAEHGDLVNEDDVQYRRWRAFSRSRPILGSFLALPGTIGVPLSQWLERRMRTTNLDYKRRFPESHALRHAERVLAASGTRWLVLGHFHVELRLPCLQGEIIVLPDWKRARRHALFEPDAGGRMSLVDSRWD